MITEYHRPETMEEALRLLERAVPRTIPVAGGTAVSHLWNESVAVVDIQRLGLAYLHLEGNWLKIGAATTLETLCQSQELPASLRNAALEEVSANLRHSASIAGTLVEADGRSLVTLILLALDASLIWAPGNIEIPLGEWLIQRKTWKKALLLLEVKIPTPCVSGFEFIARTPKDLPIVSAGIAKWKSGRTRVVLGGYGSAPLVAIDGPDAGGVEEASRDAYSQAGDDWASPEYRMNMAGVLVNRLMKAL